MSAVPMASRCLKGDTVIIRADSGWPVTLEAFVHHREGSVHTMRTAGVFVSERPCGFSLAPGAHLFRVTTHTGRCIEATADQAFLTHGGVWKTLEALSPTDAVAVVSAYPDLASRGDTDGDLIKLLVYLTAREARVDNSVPAFTDPELRYEFRAAVAAKGDQCEDLTDEAGRAWLRVVGDDGDPSRVQRYLELVDVVGREPEARCVPDFVFGLRREKLRLFLSRAFSCDATIETSGRITYETRSIRMARQIQHLLARFGVVSLLRGYEPHGRLEAVHLHIATKTDVVRFIDEVGFVGDLATRAEEVRAALYHTRVAEPSPGRLGHLLWDPVISIEATTAEIGYSVAFEARNFAANDFIVRGTTPFVDTQEPAFYAEAH